MSAFASRSGLRSTSPSPIQDTAELAYRNNHSDLQANGHPNWTQVITDVDDYYHDPPHVPTNSFMRHVNRSVPSLPSEQLQKPESVEAIPSLPSRNPARTLDGFAAMRISDPVPRAASAMSHSSDPADFAVASTSALYPNHYAPARLANGSPPATHHAPPPRSTLDTSSLYPRDGRQNSVHSDIYSDQYTTHTPVDQGPQLVGHRGGHSQPAWITPSFAAEPLPLNHDPLHAAASSILGMGPPLGVAAPSGYSASHGSLAGSQYSVSSSQSAPHVAQLPSDSFQQGQSPSSYSAFSSTPNDDSKPARPSLQRSGTTASVILRTQKTKAVDLSAPPYTKEYIDQYRQRIKADPDPEAHFLYAKYLIEAAKRIGAGARDQRAVKKYRDMLVAESLKVVRRLATQGQPYDEAQFFLANCYGTGTLGLQVDHERAYHLYLQAAKQNHPAASYRVAVCNEIGAGTRREPPRAAAFYRKAASLGDTPAMYKLGMILLHGSLGEAKNPREAINWLKRAAEQADEENPHALHELGLLHEQTNSPLVVHDPVYAKNLFTQAAHLGYTASQYKLGQCYEYGSLTCPVDPRRSIAWYTKAAEKGDPEAELALSGWYLTGSEGVLKQSDSEAYLWARRAANKGLSKAEYAVGYYAEVGIGIKQDIEFAKRWYMRAAAQGNKRAMNRLTELKRMGNRRTGNVVRPTRQQAKDECVIS